MGDDFVFICQIREGRAQFARNTQNGLIQSQTFGTSIAESLRVYSDEMRDKRVMRAEEKANKIPTKMTLATMMLTVPPLIMLLVGPSVYDIYVMMNSMTL